MPLPLTGRNALRYGRHKSPLTDPDAAGYFARAGITDPTVQAAIAALVIGLKNAQLWSGFTQAYLLQAAQNGGAGTTVYGLLPGTNGTLVNGTRWGTTGLLCDATRNQMVTTPLLMPAARTSFAVATLEEGYNLSRSGLICFASGGTTGDAFGYAPAAQRGTFRQGAESPLPMTLLAPGFNTVVSAVASAGNTGPVTLGTFSPPPTHTFQGTYAAALFFNRVLTSGEQFTVYTLLKETVCANLGLP